MEATLARVRQTSYRKVVGLISAARLREKPACIPQGRPRGAKAAGLRYERVVERNLQAAYPSAGIKAGVWFEYLDANGRGYCQVDFLIYRVLLDDYIVGECKLTDTPSARGQLRDLYLPVVAKALGTQVSGLIITRNLTPASPREQIHGSIKSALRACVASQIEPPIWHYLGRGPV